MAGGARMVVLAALVGNLLIFITKLVAAYISGSSAMLAETFHSLSDSLNQVLLIIGLKLAAKPPDERHPFGYGAEQYFWSLIVAMALFGIAGGLSVYEGLDRLGHPQELKDLNWIYGTLGLSLAFEACSFGVAYREVRNFQREQGYSSLGNAIVRSKDPVTTAVLMEDSLALVGLTIAFFAILGAEKLEMVWLDGAASLLIGLLLMSFSLFLAAKVKALLIGQAAEPERVNALRQAIEGLESVDRLLELRTMHLSPDMVLINMEVAFAAGLNTDGVAEATHAVDLAASRIFPKNLCYVETEDPVKGSSELDPSSITRESGAGKNHEGVRQK